MFVLVRADGVADFAAERMNKLWILFFLVTLMPNRVEGCRQTVK